MKIELVEYLENSMEVEYLEHSVEVEYLEHSVEVEYLEHSDLSPGNTMMSSHGRACHGRCNGFWWIPDGSTVLKTMMTIMGTPMYLLKMPWMYFQVVSMRENVLMIMDLLKLPWMDQTSSHMYVGEVCQEVSMLGNVLMSWKCSGIDQGDPTMMIGDMVPWMSPVGDDDNGFGNALGGRESLKFVESMSQDDHELYEFEGR